MTSNSTQGGPWDSNGLGGSGMGGVYDADYDEPYEVSVDNGLTVNSVKQSVAGENYVDGRLLQQQFPVTAGVVDSYGKMEFDGGYLQIGMKEPAGDGDWPSLWLLPGAGAGNVGNNFEIDIQEGGYTDGAVNPDDVMAYHLHTPSGAFGGLINTGIDLTASFNTYAVDWLPGQSITWLLNGVAVSEITSAQAPIPDEPMELVMSNQVATSAASGWHTSLDGSTPYSMPMEISDVKLYQTPDTGETVTGSNVNTQPASGSPPSVAIITIGANTKQPTQLLFGVVDIADAGAAASILDGSVDLGKASVGSDGYWSASVTLAYEGVNILIATATDLNGTATSPKVDFIWSPAAKTIVDNASGDQTYTLGNQNYQVTLDGYYNSLTAGSGTDQISLAGFNNSVMLGPGEDVVNGGRATTILLCQGARPARQRARY